MNQIFESLLCSTEAAHRQTVNCLQFRRPSIYPCPNIPLKSSHAGSLLCQSQPFLAGMHYLLGCNGSGVAMMTYLGTQTARKIA